MNERAVLRSTPVTNRIPMARTSNAPDTTRMAGRVNPGRGSHRTGDLGFPHIAKTDQGGVGFEVFVVI
jgi:hypothetical protein